MSRGYDRKRSLEFEHTRAICWILAKAHSSEPVKPMQDFWPLPTDEDSIEQEQEDLNALQARLMLQYKQLFPNKFKA